MLCKTSAGTMAASSAASRMQALDISDPALEMINKVIVPGIIEARRLKALEDDETEPYKSIYAAGDLLSSLQKQAADICEHNPALAPKINHAIAFCKLERGLALLETDLTADGQKALEESLEFAWPSTYESFAAQQQAHNALAGLWCSREEFDTSLLHLKTAAELYSKMIRMPPCMHCSASNNNVTQQTPQQDPIQINPAEEQPSSTSLTCAWDAVLTDVRQIEANYTTTLYYMAQVYGHAGDKAQSASYCAATLNRQLKEENINVNEWVQNCLQLSGYFLDGNAFALSQYSCEAVRNMLLRWYDKQQCDVQQAAVGCSDQQQQQPVGIGECQDTGAGQQPTAEPGCAQSSTFNEEQHRQQQQGQQQGQDSQGKDQAAKQQLACADKSSKTSQQQQGMQPGSKSGLLQAALQLLDEDVAANVRLAFAKLHLYTLVASHERFVEGKQLAYRFATPADVPAVLTFDALQDLPQLSSFAWGDAALAAEPEAALHLFRAALPWFREALEYYRLEGWVTEHCNILFEMSNLYRCLAGFEPEPHKRCVIHRQRAKLLQPLEGQLSPQHYPGLARSISLELGNIFREIGDIKAAAAREPDKVAAAALAASRHYQLFLDSFKDANGTWPLRVEQEMEQHYLSAAFCMARVLQTSAMYYKAPSAHVSALEHAVSWLDRAVAYVEANKVDAFNQEAQLAKEMASLLREKVALSKTHTVMQQRMASA